MSNNRTDSPRALLVATAILIGLYTACGAFPLTLLFLALKLCHVIGWPWLWVLCPAWGPFAFLLVLVGVALLAIEVGDRLIERRLRRRRSASAASIGEGITGRRR